LVVDLITSDIKFRLITLGGAQLLRSASSKFYNPTSAIAADHWIQMG
jgi:hypothetical protein